MLKIWRQQSNERLSEHNRPVPIVRTRAAEQRIPALPAIQIVAQNLVFRASRTL